MAELRYAIEHEELLLHYQPKISFKTQRVIGVEALVRWNHPKRGMIPPVQFIEPAEKSGAIKPLTRWVLRNAMRQSRAWRDAGIEIPISVNLSARNLQDPRLPDLIADLAQGAGIQGDSMTFEITESAIMTDPDRALEILNKINGMGYPFSIDDFGMGYSSLNYLRKLPVSWIKVDRSFVINMVRDPSDAAIVRSTIDLAHNLGLRVVAEGVETQEIWSRLAAMGCDAAQGYYMSRPLSVEDVTRWFSESQWGTART
jgi:EAL domain-containing protein (putative c-di-GMP-specific phosphodiesterase class I)